MRTGHCNRCPKHHICAIPCRILYAELKRIENGRRKKYIIIVYEHELTGHQLNNWNATVYGAKYEEE